MRITSILLFVFTLCANTKTIHSQNDIVKLSMENVSLKDVFREIEKQSEYLFFYNKGVVNTKARVSLNTEEKEISEVLNQLFKGTNISWKLVDKQIVITSVKEHESAGIPVVNQQKQVTGRVTDEYGGPIIGVNVIVKGTTRGVVTDLDGNYSIQVPENGVLQFSYIGYLTMEESAGNRQVINVSMKENVQIMDEVVVIGYGTVKRANLGGAVATADSRVFESRPVQNAQSALMGEIPGLTIIRQGGDPTNQNIVMRIRDRSSVNGGSPLILIDGAEGDLSTINPADIENISVLKDGTAAIYGARAADGVVLVTTKNANKNQKLQVTFDASYSVKTPALLRKPASLLQHAEMALEITDGSFRTEYTEDELEKIRQGSNDVILPGTPWGRWNHLEPKFYKNQDWNEMMIGNGNLQTYNVGISGGGERYTYLISLGHQREDGLLNYGKDLNQRYYVRLKSNVEISKNLNYDLNVSYDAGNRNYSSAINKDLGQSVWELIYKTRTWAPMYNPAGRFYTFEGFVNPAQALVEGGEAQRISGNFAFNNSLTWKIVDGLNLIGRATIRKSDTDEYRVMKGIYYNNWLDENSGRNRFPNSAERNYAKTLSKNFTLYAEYKKLFKEKHDLGVMLGTSHESADYDRFWARRINFDQQEHMPINLGSPQDQNASGEGNAWTINSFFSRLNYGFAGKYFIEATLRGDGSSRFASDARWGYFPGASATWRIGDEEWIKSLNIFNDLKFRASYGEMGNQSGIGYYDYISLINISGDYYPFGTNTKGQMAKQANLVSSARTWETVVSTNVGVDFSVLKDRLYGSFDYFWKNNNNMLIPVTYPSVLGISAPSTNSGKLEIHGWEAILGWRDRIGEFNYSITANVSDAQNKVVSRIGTSLINKGNNGTPVGYPMDSWFGYVFDGIIQNEQELSDYKALFPNSGTIQDRRIQVGDAKYKDLNGDGNLTAFADGEGDLVYLGNTNPRFNFGMNIRMEWKGFDLSMFFQGVGKRIMFLQDENNKPFAAEWYQSPEYWYGKTWTAERTNARYPAISNDGTRKNYNYDISTNTAHSAAYVRMKNLQLGYVIPQRITQKAKLERVRIYFSGEDIFEFHNTPGGWDPEEGGTYREYPFARNYAVGLNLVF
ncbi:MAG: TonB-dependent receptor [Tannerellaceae bacterium]|nr:TonB-dependent receptor [Tannerellaceae bacterium]